MVDTPPLPHPLTYLSLGGGLKSAASQHQLFSHRQTVQSKATQILPSLPLPSPILPHPDMYHTPLHPFPPPQFSLLLAGLFNLSQQKKQKEPVQRQRKSRERPGHPFREVLGLQRLSTAINSTHAHTCRHMYTSTQVHTCAWIQTHAADNIQTTTDRPTVLTHTHTIPRGHGPRTSENMQTHIWPA